MPTQELVAGDPAVLGPYRLERRLGSGGMGVVYLAVAPDGQRVAVKCLPPGVGGEVRARLQREAQVLASVHHPRVAAYVDADTTAPRPWVAMQFVAGQSLADAAVPLGPAQLRHLAEGLADALAALHRQGLTHRDVKPGNVILTHAGPVLVDLGIAAGLELTALTQVGMVVGTPEWMAPEQLTGTGGGPALDVWGWAAVAVFAATGRAPFGTGPVEALAHRIRFETPDLRGVPDWLAGAVRAALAKDPRSRPAAAALAAVDGIRRVGRTVAPPIVSPVVPPVVPPPVAPPVAPVARRVAPPVPPRSSPGPRTRVEPWAPVAGPPRAATRPPTRREARRAVRQAPPTPPVVAPRRVPAPVVAPPPLRPARRRPSLLRRLVRRLVWTVVLLVLVAVLAVGAAAWARQALSGVPVGQTLRELWRSLAPG